jgi:hypothetical protein
MQCGDVPQLRHDFDAVEACDFPPISAYEHSVQRKRILIPQPIRSATIAKTSEVRAMARVVQALIRNPNLEMEIFDTEAARWRGWRRSERARERTRKECRRRGPSRRWLNRDIGGLLGRSVDGLARAA